MVAGVWWRRVEAGVRRQACGDRRVEARVWRQGRGGRSVEACGGRHVEVGMWWQACVCRRVVWRRVEPGVRGRVEAGV